MDGDVLMFAQVMSVIVGSVASLTAIGLVARILWRWGSPKEPPIRVPQLDDERQRNLEASVEAIAIEVERISEAQRFMVGLLSDSAALRRPERAEIAGPERAGRTVTPH